MRSFASVACPMYPYRQQPDNQHKHINACSAGALCASGPTHLITEWEFVETRNLHRKPEYGKPHQPVMRQHSPLGLTIWTSTRDNLVLNIKPISCRKVDLVTVSIFLTFCMDNSNSFISLCLPCFLKYLFVNNKVTTQGSQVCKTCSCATVQ